MKKRVAEFEGPSENIDMDDVKAKWVAELGGSFEDIDAGCCKRKNRSRSLRGHEKTYLLGAVKVKMGRGG